MINARAETLAQKPAFRDAARLRRCLVVADGFYEWQRLPDRKQPYFIRLRDGGPLAFAGLWERWEDDQYGLIESCTIITTSPNDLVRPLHNRMPVILAPADYDRWLDPGVRSVAAIHGLLRPLPAELMDAYAVSTLVNRPANDVPACIEPLATPA
jgi:putative SOS response-associated peptidase YedK